MTPEVTLFTDGACRGNPGPGGWGVVLQYGTTRKILCGGDPATTNNRMELTAVVRGLQALSRKCSVKVVTDSQYVQRAMTRHLERWIASGWRSSRGSPVANRDLWEALAQESRRHRVTWTWIRGHGASADQNRCDRLAQQAARSLATAA